MNKNLIIAKKLISIAQEIATSSHPLIQLNHQLSEVLKKIDDTESEMKTASPEERKTLEIKLEDLQEEEKEINYEMDDIQAMESGDWY